MLLFLFLFKTIISLHLTQAVKLNQANLIQIYGYPTHSVYIDLSYSSIESIDPFTFQGYSNLKTINLVGNKLISLSNGLFQNLNNLTQIWLESNFINSIDKNIFSGLNNLELVR